MIIFIWGNSLVPASQSSELSGGITYQIYEFLHLSIDFELFHHFIRKVAHFSEYAILGVFTISWMKEFINQPKFSVILCFLVACIDETIQYFVPGRSNQFSDVCIDTCGALFGIFVFIIILNMLRKRNVS